MRRTDLGPLRDTGIVFRPMRAAYLLALMLAGAWLFTPAAAALVLLAVCDVEDA